ncbi:glycoside hydrolase family 6 protein [Actinomycetospora chiangmaiensis]|uniref:glycoside hydrolase family 6 protein n=1 Tax=Actinomycetospora chiangmaiensis TaxID=402650 RepID=UPI000366C9B8|nr:glycoside hydrolase family 6 protein [Actinomycetospora chiangmaiensis]
MTARLLVALAVGFLLAGCAASGPRAPEVGVSAEFWSDPASSAVRQAEQWRSGDRRDDAAQLDKIARRPRAVWLGSGDPFPRARDVLSRAGAAGRTAVLVAYDIPGRDCGQFSAGGAGNDAEYRTWTGRLAEAVVGQRRPVVVLEPDALAQSLSSCRDRAVQARREALLSGAVATLTAVGAEVYLDAGNPGFVTDTATLADSLRRAGVGRAAGFALNVANFHPTDEVVAYGRAISDRLGGARFVVDTGRNGRGVYAGPDRPTWCNPPGRALGPPPTRSTGDLRVAAFLWIKGPGESDGSCHGAPAAGTFMPDYALDLARASDP